MSPDSAQLLLVWLKLSQVNDCATNLRTSLAAMLENHAYITLIPGTVFCSLQVVLCSHPLPVITILDLTPPFLVFQIPPNRLGYTRREGLVGRKSQH